jgi:hypothetical protein
MLIDWLLEVSLAPVSEISGLHASIKNIQPLIITILRQRVQLLNQLYDLRSLLIAAFPPMKLLFVHTLFPVTEEEMMSRSACLIGGSVALQFVLTYLKNISPISTPSRCRHTHW